MDGVKEDEPTDGVEERPQQKRTQKPSAVLSDTPKQSSARKDPPTLTAWLWFNTLESITGSPSTLTQAHATLR